MGPFTLSDLVGIDIGAAAMESMYEQFYHEPAYVPSPPWRCGLPAASSARRPARAGTKTMAARTSYPA